MNTLISKLWFDFKKTSFNRTKESAIRAELSGLTLRIEDISHSFSSHQSYEQRMLSLMRKVEAFVSALAEYDKVSRGMIGGTPRLDDDAVLARITNMEKALISAATTLYQHVRTHVSNNEFDGLFFHELVTNDCLNDVCLNAIIQETCHLPEALNSEIVSKLTPQLSLVQNVSAALDAGQLAVTVVLRVQYTQDNALRHDARSTVSMPLDELSIAHVVATLRGNKEINLLYRNAATEVMDKMATEQVNYAVA